MTLSQLNRPMICPQIDVPAGGWEFQVDVSVSSQYDTNISATIPEGTYFITGHGKFGDDLLATLAVYLNNELNPLNISVLCGIYHDFTATPHHMTFFAFGDSGVTGATGRNVRLKTSASDPDLVAALGFTTTDAESTSVNYPNFNSPRQPFVWFARNHGCMTEHDHENAIDSENIFSRTVNGDLSVVETFSTKRRTLGLSMLTTDEAFSGGVDYGSVAYPHDWNRGLECLYRHMMRGKRARVYWRYIHQSSDGIGSGFSDYGVMTGGSATTIEDSGKAWDVDPDRWGGRVALVGDAFRAFAATVRFAPVTITSNTTTTLTINQLQTQYPWASAAATLVAYYLFDTWGEEYYLDMMAQQSFEPRFAGYDDGGNRLWDVTLNLIAATNEPSQSIAEPT